MGAECCVSKEANTDLRDRQGSKSIRTLETPVDTENYFKRNLARKFTVFA